MNLKLLNESTAQKVLLMLEESQKDSIELDNESIYNLALEYQQLEIKNKELECQNLKLNSRNVELNSNINILVEKNKQLKKQMKELLKQLERGNYESKNI